MSTRFFTNQGDQTLLRKFRGVFESNADIEWFDALVGYLRASGYFAIRPFLSNVPHIRILVGINVDAIMADYHRRGLLFMPDPTKALEEFKSDLRKDIQGAAYSKETENGILQFVADVASKKIAIRAHPTQRLHAKLYIFRPKGFNEHKPGAVITGSSNLTAAGLGTSEEVSNYEFNVLLHDYDDVRFATDEFERLWDESTEILPKSLQQVRDSTYLADDVSPHELFGKLLVEYFGPSIEYDPNAITDVPKQFKRLAYQMDAVSSGFRLLEKHNGFFLADVVGLGKTIVATLIAKKFFFYNGFPEHRSHTLIVVAPAVRDNWEWTVEQFRLDNVKIQTNGSLHKVRHPERFDLVIVDEAHKFRNDTAEAFDDLQRICKTPTQRELPGGGHAGKKVILVSATPLNNRPDDIRNQIALFQDLKDATLSIANLQHFFAQREKEYRQARKEPDIETARRQVKNIYELIRTKVISEVIVRRTRTDLLEHDQYSQDLAEQGVTFPTVEKPRAIYYPLSPALEDLYDRTVALLSDPHGLTYNRYRAIGFLKPSKKRKYQNADRISQQLAFIMRTLLVKRLDSSFHAFRLSLSRFREATSVMRDMFAKGTIYIAPNLNVTEFLIEGREDELIAEIAQRQVTDPTIEVCTPGDFEDEFLPGLESDFTKLDALCHEWGQVQEDPKFAEFLTRLKGELFEPKINHEGNKLVIFSEAKDTTDYLRGRLAEAGYTKVLIVDSTNRQERMPLVQANFDANYAEHANDYDILLSTEVLAEGINLHRANIIVNYDTPWNSTRLMQRVGRLNRIGCVAPRIYIYNFYPTARVDDDIELKKKAIMKLQAFHTALGEDSQIYSETEEVDTFGLFERSPEEEERDERLALLMELRTFRQQHPEQFRRIHNLPLRARVGRSDTTRAGSTVTFIRSHRRDGFYRLTRGTGVPPVEDVKPTGGRATGVPPVPFKTYTPCEPVTRRQGAYLPHWTQEGDTYAINFRLADSLPQPVWQSFLREREDIVKSARLQNRELSEAELERVDHLYSERIEAYLDAGHGACWLRHEPVAALVQNALRFFDGDRYRLAAWCVMPNHVHVVFQPLNGHHLPDILHSWKSYTSKEALKLIRAGLGRDAQATRGTGILPVSGNAPAKFWQDEYYDHIIRNQKDFEHEVRYALDNPAKAGLVNWHWLGRAPGLLPHLYPPGAAPDELGRDAQATRGTGVPPVALSTSQPTAKMAVPQLCLEEITLLEAAREFRAPDPNEKPIPLHPAHHDHVNAALARFKEQSTAQALQAEVADAVPGPNERRALAYLDGFLSLPLVSDEEKRLIKAARQAIRRARFLKLQRQINQLQRSTKEVKIAPAALADKLIQILRGYPLLDQSDQPVTAVHPRFLDTPPDIILSESFDQPPTE